MGSCPTGKIQLSVQSWGSTRSLSIQSSNHRGSPRCLAIQSWGMCVDSQSWGCVPQSIQSSASQGMYFTNPIMGYSHVPAVCRRHNHGDVPRSLYNYQTNHEVYPQSIDTIIDTIMEIYPALYTIISPIIGCTWHSLSIQSYKLSIQSWTHSWEISPAIYR